MYMKLEDALEVSNRLLVEFNECSPEYKELFKRYQNEQWRKQRGADHRVQFSFMRNCPSVEKGVT